MKTKQSLLVLLTLIMATAFFSCSMDMPEAENLSDSGISRSSASACPEQQNYCLIVDYWAKSTADGDVRKSTPTGTYKAGTEITAVAEPCLAQNGYFAGWYDAKYEGKLVSKEATYSFKLTGNTKLYARFDRGHHLLIEYEALSTASGQVSWNGNPDYIYFYPEGRIFPRGTEMKVVATAYEPGSFTGWYDAKEGGNLLSTEPLFSFTLTEDTALYPRFYSSAVNFPDPVLDRVVRELVRKPTGQLTFMNVYDKDKLAYIPDAKGNLTPISNLSGLENMIGLKQLLLSNNKITDITALTKLTKLQYLHLNTNQITDISSLANITNLRELNLNNNQISDISSLANYQMISRLNLSQNQLSDITPLTNIEIVGYLNLSNNQISDISPLATTILPYTEIDLSNNLLIDITPLIENPTVDRYNTIYLRNNNIPAEQIEALRQKGASLIF